MSRNILSFFFCSPYSSILLSFMKTILYFLLLPPNLVMTCTQIQTEPWECLICKVHFPTMVTLKEHIASRHSILDGRIREGRVRIGVRRCPECSKLGIMTDFRSLYDVMMHHLCRHRSNIPGMRTCLANLDAGLSGRRE